MLICLLQWNTLSLSLLLNKIIIHDVEPELHKLRETKAYFQETWIETILIDVDCETNLL